MSDREITLDEWQAEVDRVLRESADNNPSRNHAWSPEEVAVLKRWYGKVRTQDIATALGRTLDSVYSAARKRNLCFETNDYKRTGTRRDDTLSAQALGATENTNTPSEDHNGHC